MQFNLKHIGRPSAAARVLWFCLAVSVSGCEPSKQASDEVRFLATIPPIAFILSELTEGRAEVGTLLAFGASPHTYEPRPSDVMRSQNATALFSVSAVLDGWADDLPSRTHVRTIDFVPREFRLSPSKDGHAHGATGEADPHYWLDPLTVRAMLPALAKKLSELDPAGAAIYARNAEAFAKKLEKLHAEAKKALAPAAGESVVLFHPGFEYLLRRYGIETAGLIEPYPGKEPTPKYLVRLLKQIETSKAKAIFTEPQLPSRPAEIIRSQTSLPVATLDPLGAKSGRKTYAGLIGYNVETIRRSLEP